MQSVYSATPADWAKKYLKAFNDVPIELLEILILEIINCVQINKLWIT